MSLSYERAGFVEGKFLLENLRNTKSAQAICDLFATEGIEVIAEEIDVQLKI